MLIHLLANLLRNYCNTIGEKLDQNSEVFKYLEKLGWIKGCSKGVGN